MLTTKVTVSGPPRAFAEWNASEGEDVSPTEFLLDEDDELVQSEVAKLRRFGFTSINLNGRHLKLAAE